MLKFTGQNRVFENVPVCNPSVHSYAKMNSSTRPQLVLAFRNGGPS